MDARRPDAATRAASAILVAVRERGPRTRLELAEDLDVARTTVSLRIEPLLDAGLLVAAVEESTGGRPVSRLSLHPGARLVAAVDLGHRAATVALCDLTGSIVQRSRGPVRIEAGPEAVLTTMTGVVDTLLAAADRSRTDLAGIGVGLPGPVDHVAGRAVQPPTMPGWDGYDVAGRLRVYRETTVLVDNDVNLMALGERSIAHPGVDDLVFVQVGSGIGAGIISGGMLRRGAHGIAGDIAHLAVVGSDRRCPCGRRGCLAVVASGAALAARLSRPQRPVADAASVADLVLAGDADAIAVVAEAGRHVGEVLVAGTAFVNPAVIVVGGPLARAGVPLVDAVAQTISAGSLAQISAGLRVVASAAGHDAGVRGAAMMVLDHLFSPAGIASLLSGP